LDVVKRELNGFLIRIGLRIDASFSRYSAAGRGARGLRAPALSSAGTDLAARFP
jgi:hypothetical protein